MKEVDSLVKSFLKIFGGPLPETSVLLWAASVALFLEFVPIRIPFVDLTLSVPAWGVVFYLALKFVLGDIRRLFLRLTKSMVLERFGPTFFWLYRSLDFLLALVLERFFTNPLEGQDLNRGL